jgi:hypothetical protein
MENKKAFVASIFERDPTVKQLDLSRAVREKFGKGLSFVHVRKLREAFADGSFDRVWSEMFATEPDLKRSQASLGKAPTRRKKSRGERRRKTLLKGRRDIDRDKIVVTDFNSHLVVYRTHEGLMHSRAFKSRKRAERMVNQLLVDGVPANEIGYFRRNEIKTKVVL